MWSKAPKPKSEAPQKNEKLELYEQSKAIKSFIVDQIKAAQLAVGNEPKSVVRFDYTKEYLFGAFQTVLPPARTEQDRILKKAIHFELIKNAIEELTNSKNIFMLTEYHEIVEKYRNDDDSPNIIDGKMDALILARGKYPTRLFRRLVDICKPPRLKM